MVSSGEFLSAVYSELEFDTGAGYFMLLDSEEIDPDLAQSSWLKQAKKLGAESIFFINDFPAILFFSAGDNLSMTREQVEDEIRELHVRVWNTSLIPLFFVALPDELRIYNSYQKPIKDVNVWLSKQR